MLLYTTISRQLIGCFLLLGCLHKSQAALTKQEEDLGKNAIPIKSASSAGYSPVERVLPLITLLYCFPGGVAAIAIAAYLLYRWSLVVCQLELEGILFSKGNPKPKDGSSSSPDETRLEDLYTLGKDSAKKKRGRDDGSESSSPLHGLWKERKYDETDGIPGNPASPYAGRKPGASVLTIILIAILAYDLRRIWAQMLCHFSSQFLNPLRPRKWTMCLFDMCVDFGTDFDEY